MQYISNDFQQKLIANYTFTTILEISLQENYFKISNHNA